MATAVSPSCGTGWFPALCVGSDAGFANKVGSFCLGLSGWWGASRGVFLYDHPRRRPIPAGPEGDCHVLAGGGGRRCWCCDWHCELAELPGLVRGAHSCASSDAFPPVDWAAEGDGEAPRGSCSAPWRVWSKGRSFWRNECWVDCGPVWLRRWTHLAYGGSGGGSGHSCMASWRPSCCARRGGLLAVVHQGQAQRPEVLPLTSAWVAREAPCL